MTALSRCHTELQLACQNKAAPRSFLYLPPSTYSTFPVQHLLFFLASILHLTHTSHFFPPFPHLTLSILPVLLSYNSTILHNSPMLLSTQDKASRNTCSVLMDTEVKGVLENLRPLMQKKKFKKLDVVVYTAALSVTAGIQQSSVGCSLPLLRLCCCSGDL